MDLGGHDVWTGVRKREAARGTRRNHPLIADGNHQPRVFLDLRNKHFAHAVNGFERSIVFADIHDRRVLPAGIHRIGKSHTSLSRLARVPAGNLNRLCEGQIALLTRRIDELHQDVSQELVTLGVDAVYELPEFEPPVLDGPSPRSPRCDPPTRGLAEVARSVLENGDVKLRASARILKKKAVSSFKRSIEAFNSVDDDGRMTAVLMHAQQSYTSDYGQR